MLRNNLWRLFLTLIISLHLKWVATKRTRIEFSFFCVRALRTDKSLTLTQVYDNITVIKHLLIPQKTSWNIVWLSDFCYWIYFLSFKDFLITEKVLNQKYEQNGITLSILILWKGKLACSSVVISIYSLEAGKAAQIGIEQDNAFERREKHFASTENQGLSSLDWMVGKWFYRPGFDSVLLECKSFAWKMFIWKHSGAFLALSNFNTMAAWMAFFQECPAQKRSFSNVCLLYISSQALEKKHSILIYCNIFLEHHCLTFI